MKLEITKNEHLDLVVNSGDAYGFHTIATFDERWFDKVNTTEPAASVKEVVWFTTTQTEGPVFNAIENGWDYTWGKRPDGTRFLRFINPSDAPDAEHIKISGGKDWATAGLSMVVLKDYTMAFYSHATAMTAIINEDRVIAADCGSEPRRGNDYVRLNTRKGLLSFLIGQTAVHGDNYCHHPKALVPVFQKGEIAIGINDLDHAHKIMALSEDDVSNSFVDTHAIIEVDRNSPIGIYPWLNVDDLTLIIESRPRNIFPLVCYLDVSTGEKCRIVSQYKLSLHPDQELVVVNMAGVYRKTLAGNLHLSKDK
jgi:hypothetical protein